MIRYTAVIRDTKLPREYVKWIESKRIDAINRAIMKTGKAWAGLELPSRIRLGYYFTASFGGMEIQIYKESI
jgi:hypothetical protein